MDTNWSLCFLILDLLSTQIAKGHDCGNSLSENEDYIRCTENFPTLSDIFSVICSTEGKAAFNCILGVYKQCPELTGRVLYGRGLELMTVQMQGGIDVYCDLVDEGCLPILQRCTSNMQSSLSNDMMKSVNSPTASNTYQAIGSPGNSSISPFSRVPARIAIFCGSMREVMMCIFETKEQCPKTANQMELMVKDMIETQKGLQPGYFPTYEDVKSYIKHRCSSVPDDFKNHQRCLMTSIGKTAFTECFTNFTDHKTEDCDVYFGGKICIEKYVEPDCGAKYAQVLVDASYLVSEEIPGYCALPVGGHKRLYTSAFTILIFAAGAILIMS